MQNQKNDMDKMVVIMKADSQKRMKIMEEQQMSLQKKIEDLVDKNAKNE